MPNNFLENLLGYTFLGPGAMVQRKMRDRANAEQGQPDVMKSFQYRQGLDPQQQGEFDQFYSQGKGDDLPTSAREWLFGQKDPEFLNWLKKMQALDRAPQSPYGYKTGPDGKIMPVFPGGQPSQLGPGESFQTSSGIPIAEGETPEPVQEPQQEGWLKKWLSSSPFTRGGGTPAANATTPSAEQPQTMPQQTIPAPQKSLKKSTKSSGSEQQYIEWAKKNRGDPDAERILKHYRIP